MEQEQLIQHCFNEHVKDMGGKVFFTFGEYFNFWVNHKTGNEYDLKHKDGSTEKCKVAYYPLPYYRDLRALIEIEKNGGIDFREVLVKFLAHASA